VAAAARSTSTVQRLGACLISSSFVQMTWVRQVAQKKRLSSDSRYASSALRTPPPPPPSARLGKL
jgi:hypothetical protein